MSRLRIPLVLLTLMPLHAGAQFVGDSLAAAGYSTAAISGAGFASADEFVASLMALAEQKRESEAASKRIEPPTSPIESKPGVPPGGTPVPALPQPSGTGYGFAGSGRVSTPEEAAAWKAAFLPVGSRLATPPQGSETIDGTGAALRYAMGVFFNRQDGGWVVVPAPVGARVAERPVAALTVLYGNTVYACYNGAFFVWNKTGNYAEVVSAPSGIIVTSLPPTATKTDRGGRICYEYGGTCFEPKFRGEQIVYAVR